MTSEDRNRESQAQKILGGNQNFSSKAMVDDHVQGEVDPSYLYDQVPLKVIPEGSPWDPQFEDEIEVRIKQDISGLKEIISLL